MKPLATFLIVAAIGLLYLPSPLAYLAGLVVGWFVERLAR